MDIFQKKTTFRRNKYASNTSPCDLEKNLIVAPLTEDGVIFWYKTEVGI